LRRPGARTCVNIIGPQTVVQVAERLDETMIDARPSGPEPRLGHWFSVPAR